MCAAQLCLKINFKDPHNYFYDSFGFWENKIRVFFDWKYCMFNFFILQCLFISSYIFHYYYFNILSYERT